jgi:hypothetical protein
MNNPIHNCCYEKCNNCVSHSFKVPLSIIRYYICREHLPITINTAKDLGFTENDLEICEITEVNINPLHI